MFKKLFATLIMFVLSLILTTSVYAANLSVRIEEPKTPTNQSTFKINFVAMDISGRSITVQCFKKGPSDGSFTQYGSDINLSAGGNTGNCEVSSSIISGEGSYQFYVKANVTGPAETIQSSTVTVEYKSSAPDTPGDYKKELQGSCQYKISFKTANDGKTSRVEVYRSDQTSFTADSGTRVGTVGIGPNLEGSFTDTLPDCGKTFYYVIRAFDGAGNGSGVTGDSVTKVIITSTTTTTETPVPTSGGAIPVSSSSVGEGQVLGQGTAAATPGAALGEATESAVPTPAPTPASGLRRILSNNFVRLLIVIIIAGGGYFLYRRSKS